MPASTSLTLTVRQPSPNQEFPVGVDFLVSGTAVGTGGAEPHPIDFVTVRVDSEPPVDADLTVPPYPPPPTLTVAFSAPVRLNSPGNHQVTVKATDDIGRSITKAVPVATPGTAKPLISDFVGIATLVTTSTDSRLKTPPPGGLTARLEFSSDRSMVRIVNVDPVVVGPIPDLPVIGSVTVTISRRPGEPAGSFESATGAMTLPLGLHFSYDKHVPFLLNDSDVDFGFPSGSPLTTGVATSPTGALSATGSARNAATGAITLVGASRFTGGAPLGGLECTLVLSGTISPIA